MSWETLKSILDENREIIRDENTKPPEACPICGTPLAAGPEGGLYCPFDDHYFYG